MAKKDDTNMTNSSLSDKARDALARKLGIDMTLPSSTGNLPDFAEEILDKGLEYVKKKGVAQTAKLLLGPYSAAAATALHSEPVGEGSDRVPEKEQADKIDKDKRKKRAQALQKRAIKINMDSQKAKKDK